MGSYIYQGSSVSLSSDGNTALVGGWRDNNYTGAAWVFTRSGGVWSQQGNKLVGTGAGGNAFQGISVSLSSDGNTALVGGYRDNPGGAAWVFTRSGGVWSQQGSKLVGTGAVGDASQGRSVSLSSDGSTAIVGGYKDNRGAGAAWAYVREASGFTEQSGEIPQHYYLSQNYPNPFNPVTSIQFSIAPPAGPAGNLQWTMLKVFDVLGREVATLVDEVRQPGTYTVQWDASEYASGVYLYRLAAGGSVSTRKMAVIK